MFWISTERTVWYQPVLGVVYKKTTEVFRIIKGLYAVWFQVKGVFFMGLIEMASGKSVWRGMDYYNNRKVIS